MNEEFVHCDDCFNPDSCLSRCYITEYLKKNENVALQRGETPKQLWGNTE
jgi:hypothetical protein